MKKFSLVNLAVLVVWVLPMAYVLWVYPSLPASVPLHYGFDGKPNGFGTRSEFLLVQLFISVIAGGVYLLIKYLPLIDPKKQVKYGEANFQKLAFGLVFFLSAINIGITYGTVNSSFKIDKIILPIVGLLFAFLGNIMNSIKPNYFAGVRTPWTLEDEGNWRATHRLAGKIWFVGGILLTILVLVLPTEAAFAVFIPFIIVMALIPVVYSYVYFKKHQVK